MSELKKEIETAIRSKLTDFIGMNLSDETLGEMQKAAEDVFESFPLYQRPYGASPRIQISGYEVEIVW